MGLRSAVALERGATEEILAKAQHYEDSDLPDRQKAALRLTDAYLVHGAPPRPEVQEEILEYFTAVKVVELLLRVTNWSSDKIFVSLGLDLDEPRPQVY